MMALDYRYHYTDIELLTDWRVLCDAQTFKTGAQFKPGMKLCQHFCENFWTIQNDKGLSFAEVWKDPVVMSKVLNWGKKGMSQLWLSWIRRAVYLCAGLANSSYYRPHLSKQITMMTGKSHGVLFDPCVGWGGRMLGTVANGWEYVGCEPNLETYHHLLRMVDFLEINKSVSLYPIPAERFSADVMVDVVLTSPPYFNLECYSTDTHQSYNQFPTYEQWSAEWLQPLIRRGLSMLKPDGLSAWNVMNFKKYPLVDDVMRTHTQAGWTLKTTVGFQSPLANIRKLKNKDVTYIFVKSSKNSTT